MMVDPHASPFCTVGADRKYGELLMVLFSAWIIEWQWIAQQSDHITLHISANIKLHWGYWSLALSHLQEQIIVGIAWWVYHAIQIEELQ